jgi:hypothetical protein
MGTDEVQTAYCYEGWRIWGKAVGSQRHGRVRVLRPLGDESGYSEPMPSQSSTVSRSLPLAPLRPNATPGGHVRLQWPSDAPPPLRSIPAC